MLKSAIVNSGVKPVLRNEKLFNFDEMREIKTSYKAKNDFSYSQLLLHSDTPFLLSVSKQLAFCEKGISDTIRVNAFCSEEPNLDIETFIVGYMEDDDGVLKADPILKCNEKFIEKDEIASVFLVVNIPRNIKANTYKIEVDLYLSHGFEDEKIIQRKFFDLQVFDFLFPNPENFEIHLDLWQHNSNIARKYDVKLWSDKHFEIIHNYTKSLSKLGQKAVTVVASEIPWCGQQSFKLDEQSANLFEYSLIPVTLNKRNEWEYNFSNLDKLLKINFENNIDNEIEVFGLIGVWEFAEFGYGKVIENYSDAVRIRYFDENTNSFKFIKRIDDFKTYLQALEKYFIDKNLIDKVRVVADEPSNMSAFKQSIEFVRTVAPNFKFKAAINHKEFLEEEFENLIDYVPILPFVCENKNVIEKLQNSTKIGKISTYVCCWPDYPNTFLKSSLSETRLLFWLVAYFKLDGFLRWNYTVWNTNPLENIIYPSWPAGDTNFVYPGKDLEPIYSLRYYSLETAIRDYELIKLCLKMPEGDEFISKLYKEIFSDFQPEDLYKNDFNKEYIDALDYDKYDEISRRMLEFLSS